MITWPKRQTIVGAAVGLLWLGVVVSGTALMMACSGAPGEAASPPADWPQASKVPRGNQRPTLLVFIHPHCPCSKASIGELALLMAHCQGRVDTHVLFLRPAEMGLDWVLTDTWREAARIPGVAVHRDDEGREAQLFHAETSGETELYDAKGVLIFHGGITIARGHAGDNPGRDDLEALLLGIPTQSTNTAVFGCSLFECSAKESQ